MELSNIQFLQLSKLIQTIHKLILHFYNIKLKKTTKKNEDCKKANSSKHRVICLTNL